IQSHRIRGDDLRVESLSQFQRERRLPGARGAGQDERILERRIGQEDAGGLEREPLSEYTQETGLTLTTGHGSRTTAADRKSYTKKFRVRPIGCCDLKNSTMFGMVGVIAGMP